MAETTKEKRGVDPEIIGAMAIGCCVANSVPAVMESRNAKTAVCFVAGVCVGYSVARYFDRASKNKRRAAS